MSRPNPERGRIPYTGRALQQDAQEALGNDLIRGLIELITNSDDAYAKAERRTTGKIWIGVDHARLGDVHEVVVRDRASGMTRQEMLEKLLPIGVRASGSEQGVAVRGNRGRGAKDLVAFGEVLVESIKNRRYAWVKLWPTGDYEIDDRQVTPEDRERLGIPRGSGTQVTVFCRSSVRRPQHERLRDSLSRDFQLRDIMADPRREVILESTNAGKRDRLRYGEDAGARELLLDTLVEVEGYPDTGPILLQVYKLRERSDAGPSDTTRSGGILIVGRRAIYDNSYFRYEGIPHAGWLAGRLECPYIDQLANEYDDRLDAGEDHPEENPLPIISRRRRGLAGDHPFTRALTLAVDQQLAPLVEQIEEEERSNAGQQESSDTRRALDRLGREAARLLQESLRELEEEEPPGGVTGALQPLIIVPPVSHVVVGETRTLSVICDTTGLSDTDEVLVELEPVEGVFKLEDGHLVPLEAHRSRADALVARVRVKALKTDEAILTASTNGRSNVALLKGTPEPSSPPPEPEPEALTFEKPRYKVALGKRKAIELRAPKTHADQRVLVVSDDASVVVKGGGRTTLTLDDTLGYCAGTIRIEGRALGGKATLRATLDGDVAECKVRVVNRDDGLPDLRIELDHSDPTDHRSYFDPPDPAPDGTWTLYVMVRHPSLAKLIGDDLSGEHSPEFRAVLAEVVTEALVRKVMTRKYPPSQEIDAERLYADHGYWFTKLLPRAQRVILQ